MKDTSYAVRKLGERLSNEKKLLERAETVVLAASGLEGADVITQWLPEDVCADVESWAKEALEQSKDYATTVGDMVSFEVGIYGEQGRIHKVNFNAAPEGDSKGYGPTAYSGTTASIIKQGINHLEVSKKMESQLIVNLIDRFDRLMEMQSNILEVQAKLVDKSMKDREDFYARIVKEQNDNIEKVQEKTNVASQVVDRLFKQVEQASPLVFAFLESKISENANPRLEGGEGQNGQGKARLH